MRANNSNSNSNRPVGRVSHKLAARKLSHHLEPRLAIPLRLGQLPGLALHASPSCLSSHFWPASTWTWTCAAAAANFSLLGSNPSYGPITTTTTTKTKTRLTRTNQATDEKASYKHLAHPVRMFESQLGARARLVWLNQLCSHSNAYTITWDRNSWRHDEGEKLSLHLFGERTIQRASNEPINSRVRP